MNLHIYAPELRAVQLNTGEIRPVPTAVLSKARGHGDPLETIRLWAVDSGVIDCNDDLGQFARVAA